MLGIWKKSINQSHLASILYRAESASDNDSRIFARLPAVSNATLSRLVAEANDGN